MGQIMGQMLKFFREEILSRPSKKAETDCKLRISEPEKNHLLAQPPVPANFDESAWFPHQKKYTWSEELI